jgi:hypothetical protein
LGGFIIIRRSFTCCAEPELPFVLFNPETLRGHMFFFVRAVTSA